jgi:carbon-monoxide dehydrogenase medium subunit
MAISIVNLSTRLSLDADAVVTEARIALGAVAPTPVRAVKAEKVLIGTKMTAELIDRAAQMASEDISPISDVRGSGAYRRRMARVLSRRALTATVSGLAEADSIE